MSTARRIVGGGFLVAGGVNAGIALTDPQTYATFADQSYLPFVTSAWHDVVMAHPTAWILLLAAGEIALGALLLSDRRPAVRVGWGGVRTFQVLLMLFGFGFWLWSLPALAVLLPVARRDLNRG